MFPIHTKERRLSTVVLIVTALVLGGTAFYALEEGWSLVNALYFSIITLTTVGYGDLSPTSSASKVFTLFYVICGVAVFGIFIRDLAHRTINTVASPVLGANILENSRQLTRQLALPSPLGVVALSVSKAGLLGRAGIRDRDVILSINSKSVSRVSQVFEAIRGPLFISPAVFTIVRQDGTHKVSVDLVNG